MRTKKKKYTNYLPPTPCTSDMRNKVVSYADETGESIADVIRQALAIFLLKKDGFSVSEDMISVKGVSNEPIA